MEITVSMLMSLVVLLLTLIIIARHIGEIYKQKSYQERVRQKYVDAFFINAEKVMASSSVDEELKLVIMAISDDLDDEESLKLMVKSQRRFVEVGERTPQSELANKIRELEHPEKSAVLQAIANGVLAITCLDLKLGQEVRLFLMKNHGENPAPDARTAINRIAPLYNDWRGKNPNAHSPVLCIV